MLEKNQSLIISGVGEQEDQKRSSLLGVEVGKTSLHLQALCLYLAT